MRARSTLHLPSLEHARPVLRDLHTAGGTIGSIHTLGALHQGHAEVIEMAARENDHVVVSIYPNRAQLAPGARYVHDLGRDVELAAAHGATHVISSHDEEIYPDCYRTFLSQAPAMDRLDATAVDHLFPGMITMSIRWILFVRPHRTYWGEKDIGQLILVRRAVADLLIDTTVRAAACVRFRSGVPISSRLLGLDRESLIELSRLHRALQAGRERAARGESSARAVLGCVRENLERPPLRRFRVCYVALVHPVDFAELDVAEPPFVLHAALTNGEIFHFDGLLIPSRKELRDGPPVLWLEEDWPCAG
jgi:pantoate--beta-alanine ligase